MTKVRVVRRGALTMILGALMAGCGEGPTDHHGDEPDVHGVTISVGGTPVVTVEETLVTGSLSVLAGDETPDYDIVFTDHDGAPITAGLSEFVADATVDDTGIGIFHSTTDFQGHFEGISAGATTVVVHLVHSADGDSHYDSPAITLDVN